jgi:hypothetical protein
MSDETKKDESTAKESNPQPELSDDQLEEASGSGRKPVPDLKWNDVTLKAYDDSSEDDASRIEATDIESTGN